VRAVPGAASPLPGAIRHRPSPISWERDANHDHSASVIKRKPTCAHPSTTTWGRVAGGASREGAFCYLYTRGSPPPRRHPAPTLPHFMGEGRQPRSFSPVTKRKTTCATPSTTTWGRVAGGASREGAFCYLYTRDSPPPRRYPAPTLPHFMGEGRQPRSFSLCNQAQTNVRASLHHNVGEGGWRSQPGGGAVYNLCARGPGSPSASGEVARGPR
jgi:hypothetical protein